jgi:hypothetical protein
LYVNKNGNRGKVVVGESTIDNEFMTSDEEKNMDINELNFLPECNSQD